MESDPVQVIGRLYERHAEAVRSYALRRSNRELADEVTAQVFLVAWRRRSAIPEDALPWLLGVARRVLADQRRAAARRSRLGQRLQSTAVEQTGEVTTHDRGLAAALARLRAGDREVLLLRYWEELEPQQIARAMGCSRTAAAVRLHRARRRLARELNQEGAEHVGGEQQRPACVERTETP
jgi:RNA polymerase sigma-70 factor, ECF subfamily